VRNGKNGQGEDKLVRFGSYRRVEQFWDARNYRHLLAAGLVGIVLMGD